MCELVFGKTGQFNKTLQNFNVCITASGVFGPQGLESSPGNPVCPLSLELKWVIACVKNPFLFVMIVYRKDGFNVQSF